MGAQLPLNPYFPLVSAPSEELTLLHACVPSAISSLWDVTSHTRLHSIPSKSGRSQRSQKLWAWGWAGPAPLGLTGGVPQMAERLCPGQAQTQPGPREQPLRRPLRMFIRFMSQVLCDFGKSLHFSEPQCPQL